MNLTKTGNKVGIEQVLLLVNRHSNLKVKAGLGIFLFLLALFISGQILGSNNNLSLTNLDKTNLPPFSPGHLLGTDSLGHDVFLLCLLGAKNSLIIGFCAALLSVSFGTAWGAVGATVNRALGDIMMRIVDALLSIPTLILLLALTALTRQPQFISNLPSELLSFLGVSKSSLGVLPLISIILVIASTSWLEAARIAYSKISSIKVEEFVLASVSLGATNFWLLKAHLIPNAYRIILIQTTLLISDAIVMEAGLSFLGLGLGPDTPSWGGMLRQAQSDLFYGNWWAPLVPAILISLTVLSINLFGEGMLNKSGQDNKLH